MSQARVNKDAFFEHNSCFLGKIQDLRLGLFHKTPPLLGVVSSHASGEQYTAEY